MGEHVKIAVSPPVQLGGSLFNAKQLIRVGELTEDKAAIEMTPFKQLYVEVPLDKRDEITVELKQVGLEVNQPGFVVKSLIACNFCRGAEESGLETARKLNAAIAGMETPTPLKVGFAGCALGTSEPLLKDMGIVKMRDTFDVYVGGDPKGLKASVAKRLLSGITEDRIASVVITIIDYYRSNAKGEEKFSKFVARVSIEKLQQIAGG